MFDAHTANRRERVWFMQFGQREDTVIATACGLILAAMFIVGVL